MAGQLRPGQRQLLPPGGPVPARPLVADSPAAALSIRGVDAAYGATPVLFDVDLDAHEGSLCALVGTNGAGKSTVLRVAGGVLAPRRGTVRLYGEDLRNVPVHGRVERGLVVVPGGRGTFPTLTVEESLRVGTYRYRRDRARADAAIAGVLQRYPRLAARKGVRAGALSGGEQQLLTLARILLTRPRVLLVDELTLGLAPAAAEETLALVGDLARDGLAVVLVEQSVRRALSAADRACFLERGRVRFSGPASDLAGRTDLLRPVLLPSGGGSSVEGAAGDGHRR
jgi:ABC-type branched-subunit amino acid transport system ATPase component